MVLSGFDRLGSQDVVQLMAAGVLVSPLADRAEHVAMDLDTLIANGRMVECANEIIDHLIYRDARVFPSIENTT